MANIEVLFPREDQPSRIKKWRVSAGTTVNAGRILLLYEDVASGKLEKKLKAQQFGRIVKLLVNDNDVIHPGQPVLVMQGCRHLTVMKDLCADCGADLREESAVNPGLSPLSQATVPMVHSIPELKVTAELAEKIGREDKERLLKHQQLVLLVDLDQTIVHTTNDTVPEKMEDVFHFQLYGPNSPWYHTRLRPHTRHFLKEISKLYELHICTFGARKYAHVVADILDKDKRLFSHRILSRDECFDSMSKTANLKALFPCGTDMVCIIDDRDDVWQGCTNLVQVKPYHYFLHTGDINVPPGLGKHDDPSPPKSLTDEALGITNSENNENGNNENNQDKKDDSKEDSDKSKNDDSKSSESDSKEMTNAAVEVKKEKSEKNGKTDEKEKVSNDAVKVKQEKVSDDNVVKVKQEKFSDDENDEEIVKKKKEKENDDDIIKIRKEKLSGDDVVKVKQEKVSDDNVVKVKKEKVSDDEPDKIIKKEKTSGAEDEVKKEKTSEDEVKIKKEKGSTDNVDGKQTSEKSKSGHSKSRRRHGKRDRHRQPIEEPPPEDNTEDQDDYLLYLEDILKRIHSEFYSDTEINPRLKTLKEIIPRVRSRVLQGICLTFSGLVPNNQLLRESRAYKVARAFGAEVTQDFCDRSTHLVAIQPGTVKVREAKRKGKVKIVNPDWLWTCAERWEHVDERLYPLKEVPLHKAREFRKPPAHCTSPANVDEDIPKLENSFANSINPLVCLTPEEIAKMDKEVDDDMSDIEESVSESDEDEIPRKQQDPDPDSDSNDVYGYERDDEEAPRAKKRRKNSDNESNRDRSSDDEKKIHRFEDDDNDNDDDEDDDDDDDDDEDDPITRFRRGEGLPDDLDLGDNSQPSLSDLDADDLEDDREWNAMGAALEREFLSD